MIFKILPIKIMFLEDHWFDTEGTRGEKYLKVMIPSIKGYKMTVARGIII